MDLVRSDDIGSPAIGLDPGHRLDERLGKPLMSDQRVAAVGITPIEPTPFEARELESGVQDFLA